MKDEALNTLSYLIDVVPVSRPQQPAVTITQTLVQTQVDILAAQQLLLDWYHHTLDIDAIPNMLRDPFNLDADSFIAAIRKARGAKRGPLTAAAIRHIREEHARTILPMARRLAEAMQHEQRLSDLVNEAYGLTPEDVALMWRTAPPRMPIPAPSLGANRERAALQAE